MRRAVRSPMRLARCRCGGAAIDFGMTFPLLLGFIFCVIELSRLLWGQAVLNFAVEQGARYAAIQCASSCSTSAAQYASDYAWFAIGLQPAASQFTVNTSATCGTGVSGASVSVSVTFTTPVLQLMLLGNSLSLPLAAQSCFPT